MIRITNTKKILVVSFLTLIITLLILKCIENSEPIIFIIGIMGLIYGFILMVYNSYNKKNNSKERKGKLSIEEVKSLVPKKDVDFIINVLGPLQKEATKVSNHPSDQYDPKMFDFYRNLYNKEEHNK